MKKGILILALLAVTALTTFAQSAGAKKWSIGLEGGVPVGDASKGYHAVIGGSIKYDISIVTNTAITISIGYSAFGGKTVAGQKVPARDGLPMKAGIKYHFADNFYGEAQAGTVFYGLVGHTNTFIYATGIGCNFGKSIDIGLRYENWAKNGNSVFGNLVSADGPYGQISTRLAYSF
jgi:ABC-type uncharacterized transport system permease subunit